MGFYNRVEKCKQSTMTTPDQNPSAVYNFLCLTSGMRNYIMLNLTPLLLEINNCVICSSDWRTVFLSWESKLLTDLIYLHFIIFINIVKIRTFIHSYRYFSIVLIDQLYRIYMLSWWLAIQFQLTNHSRLNHREEFQNLF